MARDISATIKINDGFSNPLGQFASKLAQSTSRLGQLGMKMAGLGRITPPTPDFERFNSTLGQTNNLFGKMVGANVVGNVISSSIGAATSSVTGLVSELNASSSAWQTFNGNMQMLGMSGGQITRVQNQLQDFAAKSIYSSSDMAQTYSQFAAVGVKNADQLVKGFGGLAAAAINPQQAMQTLSQQSVQAASRPMIQWADFKLMMEQTPAGMAQVAKTMGTSLGGLSQMVQAGTVKTNDLFGAIARTGTNAHFGKLATQYKTIGEAAQGLKETMTNKLQKSFDQISKIGINALKGLANSFDKINFTKVQKNLVSVARSIINTVSNVAKYTSRAFSSFWTGLTNSGAISAVSNVFSSVSGAIGHLFSVMGQGGKNPFGIFTNLGNIIGGAIAGAAKVISSLANAIAKIDPTTLKLLGASLIVLKVGMKGLVFTALVAGLNFLSRFKPSTLNFLAKSIIFFAGSLTVLKVAAEALAGMKALKGITDRLRGIKAPEPIKQPKTNWQYKTQVQTPAAPSAGLAKKWLQLGAVFVAVGAGALMLGAGLYLMASAATSLANAGGAAIAIFFGMFAAVGALMVLVRLLGPAMIASSVGFLLFAGAMLLIGAAIFIAAAGIAILATQLPNIANYGMQAAGAIIALGAAIAVFGALAIVGSIGLVFLSVALIAAGVSMIIAAAGAFILGAASFVLAAGIMAVAVACIVLGAGLMVVATGFQMLVGVVSNAISGVVNAVRNGFNAAKSLAENGISSIIGAVKSGAGGLLSAGAAMMNGFLSGLRSGFDKVKGFVGGIAGWIKEHKGPISYDARILIPAGNSIMNGLNSGLTNGFMDVQKNIQGITNMIANTQMQVPQLTADPRLFGNLPSLQIAGLDNPVAINNPNEANVPTNSPFNSGQSSSIYNNTQNSSNSNSNTTNNYQYDVNISVAAADNPEMTAEQVVSKFETFLKNKSNGGLGYGYNS